VSRATPIIVLAAAAIVAGCTDQAAPTAPARAKPSLGVSTNPMDGPVVLNGFTGSAYNIAAGMNGLGDIAGVSMRDGGIRAVVWPTGSTTPSEIGNGTPMDINNAGQLVGEFGGQAALWTPDGKGGYELTRINMQLPSPVMSTAYGVNAAGQVVGSYRVVPEPGVIADKCFVWIPDKPNATTGTARELPDLGGSFCVANDINSRGYVAGTSTNAQGEGHAVLWSPPSPFGLPSKVQDLSPEGGQSYATSINDAIQVAGQRLSADIPNAAVWTPNRAGTFDVTDLGTFTGNQTWAMDISNSGFVVGYADRSAGPEDDAFFWQSGSFTLLPGVSTINEPTAMANVTTTGVSVAGGSYDIVTNARTALRWDLTVAAPKPSTCLAQLIQAVEKLRDGKVLGADDARSLIEKVEASARQVEQGRTTAASNLIDAFVDEVELLTTTGRLPSDQGQTLIDLTRCARRGH
jgi:uncharacterized membrane protein